MDLIDKKDRSPAVAAQCFPRLLNTDLHVLFPGRRRVQLPEVRVGRVRDDPGQCRLARTGRSVKNDARELVCADRTVEQSPPPYNMLLSDDFRKGSRTHAAGERGFIFRMFFLHVIKKIHTFPFCFRLSAQQVIVFSGQSADIRKMNLSGP